MQYQMNVNVSISLSLQNVYRLKQLRVRNVSSSILGCEPTDYTDILLLVMICIYFLYRIDSLFWKFCRSRR
jgi:hypothetical protein